MTSSIRPTPGVARPYEFPASTRFTLGNGLRVIVAPMARLPLVTVLAVVDAGAASDARGKEGVSLLTAAALAEGTTERDGPALADAFERIGTALDCGGDWDEASVRLTVTPSRLDEAMALLAEVLMAPRFAEQDVARLKAERLADLLQERVEPRGLADERFAGVIFDDHSRYARSAGGTPASVRALTAGDARAQHASRYGAATTTIILAGDVTPDRARAMVEARLGTWTAMSAPSGEVTAHARTSIRGVHIVAKADAPQSEVRVGHLGLPRGHADYFAVVVMNAILGGLFSSRINLNLREAHAYTYGAHSMFDWRRQAGPFVVASAVKTEVTDAAVREILIEIDRIRDAEVQAEELDLATKYLAGVFPIRYETTGAVASALAVAHVFGLPADYFSTYRDRISAITRADVLAAARAHLHPEQLQILAVGDASAIEAPLAALNLGAPNVSRADDGDEG